MPAHVYMDVESPTMHVKANREHGNNCVILEVVMETKDSIELHFDNVDDLKAFIGAIRYTIGDTT